MKFDLAFSVQISHRFGQFSSNFGTAPDLHRSGLRKMDETKAFQSTYGPDLSRSKSTLSRSEEHESLNAGFNNFDDLPK